MQCFNVSHLDKTPYKLTGRKYLVLEDIFNEAKYKFESVVNSGLDFDEFITTYL